MNNKILKFFMPYIPKLFPIFLINAIAASAMALLIPWIMKIMIDEVFPQKNIQLLFRLIITLTITRLISAVLLSVTLLLREALILKITNILRGNITNKLNSLSLSVLNKEKTGNIMNTISDDCPSFVAIISIIQDLFFIFILFISQIAVVSIIAPKLLFIAIPILFLFPVLNLFTSRKFRDLEYNYRNSYGRLNNFIHEIIGGIKEIKSFNRQSWQNAVLHNYFTQLENIYLKYFKSFTISFFSNDLLRLLTDILIYSAAGLLVIKSNYTAGSAIAAATYINSLITPVSSFGESIGAIRSKLAAWDRVNAVLELPSDEYENKGDNQFPSVFEKLEFKDVLFSYTESESVLKNITLEIKKNSFISIAGLSGCGKSTIINLILKLLKPDKGQILINNESISEIKTISLRDNIAVVFQDPFLFDDTIIENLKFGNPDASLDDIISCAKKAHIHEFISSLSDKYETTIGERGVFLSGGQKQRLGIARALIKNPQILILDEATSWLDFKLEDSMIDLITELKQSMTIICVSHRINSVKQSDTIIFLNEGKIEKCGTHEELLSSSTLYNELVYNKLAEVQSGKIQDCTSLNS